MARFWISLLLLHAALIVHAQPFGRFGYSESFDLPGLTVDRLGFRARQDSADSFSFPHVSPKWSAVSTSELAQTVVLGDYAGAPSKLSAELLAPGFSMYMPLGLDLEVASIGAPYLSWSEGSVAEGVPTPAVRWALVTFRSPQPAVLLAFLDGPAALEVGGKAGAWRIRSQYRGWVRVALPFGVEPVAATSASGLGALALRTADEEALWLSRSPRLLGVDVQEAERGLVATYRFDRSGAVVPVGALFAKLGGYPIQVLSPTRRIEAATEAGPLSILEGNELRILFPMRLVPPGRAVVFDSGAPTRESASPVEMALHLIRSPADGALTDRADRDVASYLSTAEYHLEQWSGQRHPISPTGEGIRAAAENALIVQALAAEGGDRENGNPLLTSVLWRMDWFSWQLWAIDRNEARRAASCAAIAAALSPAPNERLRAAMLQAGLSAERGRAIWQRMRTRGGPTALVEPMEALRKALFLLDSPVSDDPFSPQIFSPIRIQAPFGSRLIDREGRLFLVWTSLDAQPVQFMLLSPYAIALGAAVNQASRQSIPIPGALAITFTPRDAGACEVELLLPAGAERPPSTSAAPVYVETLR